MDQEFLAHLENRCIQEEAPPCTARCPIHVDVRTFLKQVAAGAWDESVPGPCRRYALSRYSGPYL